MVRFRVPYGRSPFFYAMPHNASTPHPCDRTWADLDRAALLHNVAAARRRAAEVMAVVKADAYGHGATLVAPVLEQAGVAAFGVACLAEAQELRAAGVSRPIHLLSPVLPEETDAAVAQGLVPVVSSWEEAQRFSARAVAAGGTVDFHLALDTGMGRIGIVAGNEALELARKVSALPGVRIDSLGSHFASADEDQAFTTAQLAAFRELADGIEAAGVRVGRRQIANSAGTLGFSPRPGEMVRCGLMLWGVSPLAEFQGELRPVLAWRAKVTLVRTLPVGWGVSYGRTFVTSRPTRVATLAAGYADGYPRHLSGRGAWVSLRGQRSAVLGRVTMDQLIVEAPEGTGVGDTATLLGADGPSANELAERAGTIPYEVFTGLGRRVRRRLA